MKLPQGVNGPVTTQPDAGATHAPGALSLTLQTSPSAQGFAIGDVHAALQAPAAQTSPGSLQEAPSSTTPLQSSSSPLHTSLVHCIIPPPAPPPPDEDDEDDEPAAPPPDEDDPPPPDVDVSTSPPQPSPTSSAKEGRTRERT